MSQRLPHIVIGYSDVASTAAKALDELCDGPRLRRQEPPRDRGYWRGGLRREHREWERWAPKKGSGVFASTVSLLVQVVGEGTDGEKGRALHALTAIGPDAAPAVPALLEALAQAKSREMCDAVAEALGSIGRAARAAVPSLADLLLQRHPGGDARSAARAAYALLSIGSLRALPALVEATRSIDSGWLVRDVVRVIGHFGRMAATCAPELRRLLNDPRYVKHIDEISNALAAIDPGFSSS
jgi:hypothetical protein